MESLNKYLAATEHHLGVEHERYGGGFRAIVAPRYATEFLFGMLEGSDIEGTQAQFFLEQNPLFPSAFGHSPQEALQKLDAKLSLLYRYQPTANGKWEAEEQFDLKAYYDTEPDEPPSSYLVRWGEIVRDLMPGTGHFYEDSRDECSATHMRNLHALVMFSYDGIFANLRN